MILRKPDRKQTNLDASVPWDFEFRLAGHP
jgi:hypothetical protein